MQREPAGLLRVSAPMSLSLLRICPAVPAFLERYPQVSLDLNLEDRRVDIVKEGFDLAIRGTDGLEDSSLVARKLMTAGSRTVRGAVLLQARGRARVARGRSGHGARAVHLVGPRR